MKKSLSIIIIIAVVVLAVISFVVLPDSVITQISIGDSGVTRMPKLAALLIPTFFGLAGGFMTLEDKGNGKKGLLLGTVGILIFIITLVVNL